MLLVAEIFLRAFMPVDYLRPPTLVPQDAWRELVNKPSDIPLLDYELRPGAAKFVQGALVKTDAHGMRDAERPNDPFSMYRSGELTLSDGQGTRIRSGIRSPHE